MLTKIIYVLCVFASLNVWAAGSMVLYDSPPADTNCGQYLAAKAYINAYRDAEFRRSLAKETEITLEKKGISPAKAVGAAILIALAYGDITAANSLSSHLTADYVQFKPLIQTVGGVFAGAIMTPIWESMWSKIRLTMFSLFGIDVRKAGDEADLNDQWRRQNAGMSNTAQIARGNTNSFISRPNFHEAYNKFTTGDLRSAANNFAFAASYLRERYLEIGIEDKQMVNNVRSAFTNNLDEVPADFIERVRQAISLYDEKSEEPEAAAYYQQLLHSWFKPN